MTLRSSENLIDFFIVMPHNGKDRFQHFRFYDIMRWLGGK